MKTAKLILFFMLACICGGVHASIKAGSATVNVGSTTTVSLATTYQSTLNNSTGINYRWSTTSSNISITSQNRNSATIKGIGAGTAQLSYYCSYYIDGYYRTMDFYYDVTIQNSGSTITISPTSITVYEGETYSVSAYQPGYVGGVYFTSSNSNIAEVSTGNNSGYYTYGTVTGVSEGTTYIYAKSMSGATSPACTVTVKKQVVNPTSILLPGSKTIEVGEYIYINATVSPSNATYTLSWSSSDTDVATVSSTGRVYGKKAGTAKITAKIDGYSLSDYCIVTVKEKQILATAITVEHPTLMTIGDTYQLSPTCEPSNATTAYQFQSEDPEIATVSSSGLLSAIGAGSATIKMTETLSGLVRSFTVEVKEQGVNETDISQMDNVLYVDEAEGIANGRMTLYVKMKNSVVAESFHFNLYLPEGFSFAENLDGNLDVSLYTAGGRVSASNKDGFDEPFISEDGSVRVSYQGNGKTISGNDGAVVRVRLMIPERTPVGDYALMLKNWGIGDNMGSVWPKGTKPTIVCKLGVVQKVRGDANDDAEDRTTDSKENPDVNSADCVTIVHYIMGLPYDKLDKTAADANGDGVVNAADLTAISNLKRYGSVSKPTSTSAREEKNSEMREAE